MKRILGVAVGILAVSLLQQTANAAFASDVLTVYDGSGGVNKLFVVTEQDEVAFPNNVWRLDTGIANPALLGQATMLTEPGGGVSDIVGVAQDPVSHNYYLAFMSDTEGVPLDLTTAMAWFGNWTTIVPETAAPIDITRYLNTELLGQNYTATFQSDFEVVPEPTTMLAGALLLLPFAGSALHILRKR